MVKTKKLVIFAILLCVLTLGIFSSSAKAGFFDDVVDKLDPTQRHSLWDPFCVFCSDDNPAPAPAPTPTGANNQIPNPTVFISANPLSINYNEASTIYWNSSNATSCSASGGTNGWAGTLNTSGTFDTGTLTNTTTYNINCINSTGPTNSSVTIYVNNQIQICQDTSAINYGGALPCRYQNYNPLPTVTLYANDSDIAYNESTTIRWYSNDADYCSASGGTNGWAGTLNTSGTFDTGRLTSDRTYRIVCTNNSGSDTDSITIRVDDNNDNYYDDREPTVTLYADNLNIAYNQSTVLRWYSNYANNCRASGGTNGWSGNVNNSGTFYTGPLTSDKTYRINCANNDGSDSDSVTIHVGNQNNYNPNNSINSLTATTMAATLISNTSAELNSQITNPGNGSVNSWFEWGKTINFGNRTVITTIGATPSVAHTDKLSGLSPGTTYYFRAVVENSLWRNIGATLSFTTSGTKTSTYTDTSTTTSTDTTTKTNNTETTDTTTTDQIQSSLGASVIGANSFFPSSILGWLFAIILILILMLLVKYLYHNLSDKK